MGGVIAILALFFGAILTSIAVGKLERGDDAGAFVYFILAFVNFATALSAIQS